MEASLDAGGSAVESPHDELIRLAAFTTAVSQALIQPGSLAASLHQAADAAVRHLDAAFARIWTLDDAGQVLELQASAGLYTHLDGAHSRVPVGRLKIGRIAQSRQPHLSNAVLEDPWISDPAWARQEGMVAFAGYPLVVGERLVGVMAMFARQPFTELTLRALAAVANGIALGIERTRAEAALRASEARKRAILETALDGIITLDQNGRITEFNPAAEQMFGYPRDVALGAPLETLLVPPALRQRHRDGLTRYLATGETAILGRRIELPALRADGSEIPVELTVTRVVGEGPVQFTGFVRDISERKRTEAALQEREAQLRQAQKMEAIGQLAGGIAHDFNNLLGVVLGYSELLLTTLPAADPHRRQVEAIEQAGERAAALTRQLLTFSRKQLLVPRHVDLNGVVANLDAMLRRLIDENIDLVTVRAAHLGQVYADPGQIEQLLVNLAINARDAMPGGGRLTIATSNVELDHAAAQRHTRTAPGAYVCLTVSDTGHGMDADTLGHIFEPFFTTKEPGRGTGLGLATVHGIVEQSGGQIEVSSEPGLGTTFRISLPRSEPPAEAATAPRPVEVLPRGSETVLLVEDDPALRALARSRLEHVGYTVLAASHGAEALDCAAMHPGPIQLLLTDVVMPGMSGRELAERLRTRHRGPRVLYMSGYTDDAVLRHGVVQASAAFLQKPFTPGTLARKVREVFDTPPARPADP